MLDTSSLSLACHETEFIGMTVFFVVLPPTATGESGQSRPEIEVITDFWRHHNEDKKICRLQPTALMSS